MFQIIGNNLISIYLNKVIYIKEINGVTISDNDIGYNSFGERSFKNHYLSYGDKIEKINEYGYNIIERDGWKGAYKNDMRTVLFGGEKFGKIYIGEFLYILTDLNGNIKHIFCKDMITEIK